MSLWTRLASAIILTAWAGCQPAAPASHGGGDTGGAGGDEVDTGGAGGSVPVKPDAAAPDTGGAGGMRPAADGGGEDTGGKGGTGGPPPSDGAPPADGPTPGDAGPPPSDDEPLPPCKRTVMVAGSPDLATKLAAAQPGDCLVLADGDYAVPTITSTATAQAPIVVRAQNRGKVTTGSIALSKAAHVVLDGLTMAGASIKVQDSQYCRISRFRFKVQETTENDWIQMSGSTHHTRIDHNDLGPKNVLGNIVMFSGGAGSQVVQYNRVDHNYFHDVKGGGGNGWESIRLGLSGLAASKGFNVVEYNLFKAATGDPETISVKSCDNTIRYNTFRASRGEITLRHGNRTLVYGNFMFADGLAEARGIRVCGSQHRIFNNYLEGITASAGINLEGGDADGGPGDIPGGAHFRVYSAHVVNNTIVNGRGIVVGGGHEFAPSGCVVANNLVQNPSGAGIVETSGVGTVYEGNISSAGAGPGTKIADPKLVKTNGAFRLVAGSPAIDGAVGSYPYVTDDMDGQPRAKPDVGADELATGPLLRHPLTEADVGPDAP
ncbi:MAG TPA: polysaccharide lyase 6 family protein [Polyangia bacterium]|nr:polysaccharide lyase 6 family protein [Polyangia bacterium]